MLLLDQIRGVALRRRLARRTIDCYCDWIRRFLVFGKVGDVWRHPREMGELEVGAFLTHLARDKRLSASTQNQATNAIVFLYRRVLVDELGEDHLGKFVAERAKRSARVPTVLSQNEVMRVIDAVREGSMHRLMIELLYGTGLRVSECCTLRLRDVDFERGQIIVRGGKGDKDRIVMLPMVLLERLRGRIGEVEQRWRRDVKRGGGYAPVPISLEHKRPRVGTEFPMQFIFSSSVLRRDEDGCGARWHVQPGSLDRVVYAASLRAEVKKRVTCHAFSRVGWA